VDQRIEAIYKDGVFKPLQPVRLPDHVKVVLAVQSCEDGGDTDAELLQLLDEPFELRVKGLLSRRAIYDETD